MLDFILFILSVIRRKAVSAFYDKDNTRLEMWSVFLFIVFVSIQLLSLTSVAISGIGILVALIYMTLFAPLYIIFTITAVIRHPEFKLNIIALILIVFVIFLNNIGFSYKDMRYLKNSEVIDIAINHAVKFDCFFMENKQACINENFELIEKKYSQCLQAKPDYCEGLYEYKGASSVGFLDKITISTLMQQARAVVVTTPLGNKTSHVQVKNKNRVSSEGGIF
jgi:hypothetical protein